MDAELREHSGAIRAYRSKRLPSLEREAFVKDPFCLADHTDLSRLKKYCSAITREKL